MESKHYIITRIKLISTRLHHLQSRKNEIEPIYNQIKSITNHMRDKIGSIKSRLDRAKRNKNEEVEVYYTAWINIYKYLNNDYQDIGKTNLTINNSNVRYTRYESKNVIELYEMLTKAQNWFPIWEGQLNALTEEIENINKQIKDSEIQIKKFNIALLKLDLSEVDDEKGNANNLIEEKSLEQTNNKNTSVDSDKPFKKVDQKRGDIKRLCGKFAGEMGLKTGEELSNEDAEKIYDKIKDKGYKTTIDSVKSTLRDKLDYRKL